LLLAGRHDCQTPLACTEELQALLGCELEVFEKSGHYPFVEEPESFAKRVQYFVGHRAK
jgi:pimeloyl-ACP methyl ester carboxylesterase